jgi:transcriptional regulator with XRE-family HTH domain
VTSRASPGPQTPAEAELIRRRRETAVPPMSRRQAAAKAGISPSQWSDVERGSKKAGPGIAVPVQATAETLARMAQVVGIGPDELTAAGREDAAHHLRSAAKDRSLWQRIAAVPGLGTFANEATGTRAGAAELLPIVARGLYAIEDSKLPARTKQQLTDLFADNLRHDATRRYDEMLLIIRLAEAAARNR